MSSLIARRSAASLWEIVRCWLMSQDSSTARGSRYVSNPYRPLFTADAGEFESSPRGLRIISHAIDHDAAGTYFRRHATRTLEITSEDSGMQAILRVVGDPDRLVLRVICDYA